ncbi:hypothetical protein ACE6H2_004042 [Prunus campanulata]
MNAAQTKNNHLSFLNFFPKHCFVTDFCVLGGSLGKVQGEAQTCSSPTIPIMNCSKQSCILTCIQEYGGNINGRCIDNDRCCCKNLGLISPSFA